MKTARFTGIVEVAGRPKVHPLWLAPARDEVLQRAARDVRVMTVHQALRGTTKDFGMVGLDLKAPGQILIFPKSLRQFEGKRIVAIDYDLIVQLPAGKALAAPPVPPSPPKAARPALRPPAPVPVPERPRKPEPAAIIEKPSPRVRRAKAAPPRAPIPPPSRKPPAPTRGDLLTAIRHAVRELKAGKAGAAYERLKPLTDAAKA